MDYFTSGLSPKGDLSALGAGIAEGLLLGRDEALSWELRQQGRELGITHFMAASGSNLQVVWELGQKLSIYSWRWWKEGVSVSVLLFYLWSAGLSPSLFRASSSWLYRILGRWSGRKTGWLLESVASLLITSVFQRSLLSEAGWHLSFLATAGVYFSQIFPSGEKEMSLFPQRRRLAVIQNLGLGTGWWVFLFVSPYTWLFFESARPLSVLVTPTLEPLVRPFQATVLTRSVLSTLNDSYLSFDVPFLVTYRILAWSWLKIISLWLLVLHHAQWRFVTEALLVVFGAVTVSKGFIRFVTRWCQRTQWERLSWM